MSDWEQTIAEYLGLRGWDFHHERPARTNKGWRTAWSGTMPLLDFFCIRPPRRVWIEAKTEYDKLSDGQRRVFDLLKESGEEVYVFRPKDRAEFERVMY